MDDATRLDLRELAFNLKCLSSAVHEMWQLARDGRLVPDEGLSYVAGQLTEAASKLHNLAKEGEQ